MRKAKITRRNEAQKCKAAAKELKEIAKRFREHLKGPILDHGEALYDDIGLPK
jgi:hypothetical protein